MERCAFCLSKPVVGHIVGRAVCQIHYDRQYQKTVSKDQKIIVEQIKKPQVINGERR